MNAQEVFSTNLGVPWILFVKEDGENAVSIYLELLEKMFCRKGCLSLCFNRLFQICHYS